MSVEIEVLDDPAHACVASLLSAMLHGGEIVLTGGSTPRAAYEELASEIRSAGGDLGDTTVWFSDERCVPPHDERSNFRLLKQALLDPLAEVTAPTVHRMRGELGPEKGADAYERDLREAGEPEFDLVLLGLGPDGHCASLFPDQPSLGERARLAVGVEEAGLEPFVPRVTFTLPALSRGKRLVFLAEGEAKASAVAAAFGPDAKPDPHVPSSLVPGIGRDVIVLVDPAAASGLGGRS